MRNYDNYALDTSMRAGECSTSHSIKNPKARSPARAFMTMWAPDPLLCSRAQRRRRVVGRDLELHSSSSTISLKLQLLRTRERLVAAHRRSTIAATVSRRLCSTTATSVPQPERSITAVITTCMSGAGWKSDADGADSPASRTVIPPVSFV